MGSQAAAEPVAEAAAYEYTAAPVQASFHGFLFDMDGTIIDSTDAVVKHWHT